MAEPLLRPKLFDIGVAVAGMTCRACGTQAFEVLDMGPMPLAGDFRPPGEENAEYPLAIDGCPRCGLLQVRETVPLRTLFNAEYRYASSTVGGLVRHFEAYAKSASHPRVLNQNKLLEVGCNDGVFLGPLRAEGWDAMGIDASDNVAGMARERGLDAWTGMFGDPGVTDALLHSKGTFNVITCSNVFAHNPDLSGFLDAVVALLRPDGQFWVEVQDTKVLYDNLAWDVFCHEHCYYWTIESLSLALSGRGLHLDSWSRTPMHGGSIRAVFSRDGVGMGNDAFWHPGRKEWEKFAERCEHSREVLRDAVWGLPIRYAYGASGKAVVLINWADLGGRLEFAVDGSPLRYGRAVPGTCMPIIPEQEFLGWGPYGSGRDGRPLPRWCFVTAYPYLEDIRRKVSAAMPGTRFVTPLPTVQVS